MCAHLAVEGPIGSGGFVVGGGQGGAYHPETPSQKNKAKSRMVVAKSDSPDDDEDALHKSACKTKKTAYQTDDGFTRTPRKHSAACKLPLRIRCNLTRK